MKSENDQLYYIKIVENLNDWVYEKGGDFFPIFFMYNTDGISHCIELSFGGFVFWDSENDEREYLEVTDEYEDLEEYIKERFNEYVELLNTIKFDIKNEDRN